MTSVWSITSTNSLGPFINSGIRFQVDFSDTSILRPKDTWNLTQTGPRWWECLVCPFLGLTLVLFY